MKNRKFKIHDYRGKETTVTVTEFDTVAAMIVQELSGDEVLIVIRTDGRLLCFDSSDNRIESIDDGMAVIYVKDGFMNTGWFKESEVTDAE